MDNPPAIVTPLPTARFPITPRYSTVVSGTGMNDVTSRDKDITAVVRVTFAVK